MSGHPISGKLELPDVSHLPNTIPTSGRLLSARRPSVVCGIPQPMYIFTCHAREY